jgi:hypothetical protein
MKLRDWFLAVRARNFKYVRGHDERKFFCRTRGIGEVPPFACFGFTYYDPSTRFEYWHLMPLNWIVQAGRAIRNAWWIVQRAAIPEWRWWDFKEVQKLVKAMECEAFQNGYKQGFDAGIADIRERAGRKTVYRQVLAEVDAEAERRRTRTVCILPESGYYLNEDNVPEASRILSRLEITDSDGNTMVDVAGGRGPGEELGQRLEVGDASQDPMEDDRP